MKQNVVVEGLGELKNWYLTDATRARIGKEATCLCCNNTFVVGKQETDAMLFTEEGKAKTKVEICKFVDVEDEDWNDFIDESYNLYLADIRQGLINPTKAELKSVKADRTKVISEDPYEWYMFKDMKATELLPLLANVPLDVKAVVLGVNDVTAKVCPDCYAKNMMEEEARSCSIGSGSGAITGEIENN